MRKAALGGREDENFRWSWTIIVGFGG